MSELRGIRRYANGADVYVLGDSINDLKRSSMTTTSESNVSQPHIDAPAILDEVKSLSFFRDVLQEVISTFMLVSVQCAVLTNWHPDSGGPGPIQVGLAMGCIVAALIEAFGPVGGAHMNPAITIGFVFSRRISILKMLFYVMAQMLGAVIGSYFIFHITPREYLPEDFAVTRLHKDLTVWQGLLVEIWLTAIFLAVIHGSSNKRRHPHNMFSIPIGMVVIVAVMCADYTGSSINPARSFGPALCVSKWENHWVYWVGPITGGIVGSIIYEYILDRPDRNSVKRLTITETNGRPTSHLNVSETTLVSQTTIDDSLRL